MSDTDPNASTPHNGPAAPPPAPSHVPPPEAPTGPAPTGPTPQAGQPVPPAQPPAPPAYGAYPPAAPRSRALAGKIMTALGAVLLILGIIGSTIAIVSMARTGASVADQGIQTVEGSAPLDVTAGETRMIFVQGDPASLPDCTVTGPADAPVPVQSVGDINIDWGDTHYRGVGRFTASVSGTHLVECDSNVVISPNVQVGAFVSGIIGLVVSILVATFGGLLLIAGIIVWIVQASRRPV